ncbi:MAG: hypothetical protein Q9192_001542 [Flavoplaca navasiana]
MPPLITVKPSQLRWANESDYAKPPAALKEFSSSKGVYRSFCSSCGCSFTWRSEATPDEIEILIGSIDEKWLIGDRTEKIATIASKYRKTQCPMTDVEIALYCKTPAM